MRCGCYRRRAAPRRRQTRSQEATLGECHGGRDATTRRQKAAPPQRRSPRQLAQWEQLLECAAEMGARAAREVARDAPPTARDRGLPSERYVQP